MPRSFYRQQYGSLRTEFEQLGFNPAGVDLLFYWHYKFKNITPCITDLAVKAREYVATNFHFDLPEIIQVHESHDRTVKFLLRLHDGTSIESVLIPFQNKYTLCLSTQVGCAMKCSFCHTGTQGLKRNLETEEIVGQFIAAWNWHKTNRPKDFKILNIVYMGQGEPLHNFEAVRDATKIFLETKGICLSALKITVSTAGYLPGLERWNSEMPNVNIALSFHSPFEEKRNKLIPINQRYPLPQVLERLEEIPLKKKQFIIFEYLLIKGFNDSIEDAHATGKMLQGKRALMNLIPFNPFPGSPYQRPEMETVEGFCKVLESYRLPSMIRGTKGDDILAACGQLNTKVNSVVESL